MESFPYHQDIFRNNARKNKVLTGRLFDGTQSEYIYRLYMTEG